MTSKNAPFCREIDFVVFSLKMRGALMKHDDSPLKILASELHEELLNFSIFVRIPELDSKIREIKPEGAGNQRCVFGFRGFVQRMRG
jgi:hypothetical protein